MIDRDSRQAFAEGWSSTAHHFLGAHPHKNGVRFAVWAPNAAAVYVLGDWNNWDMDAMERLPDGIWVATHRKPASYFTSILTITVPPTVLEPGN